MTGSALGYSDSSLRSARIAEPSRLDAIAAKANAYAPDGVVVVALQGADAIKVTTALASKMPIASKPFYFTDGAKDQMALLDPALPMNVQAVIKAGATRQERRRAIQTVSEDVFNVFAELVRKLSLP